MITPHPQFCLIPKKQPHWNKAKKNQHPNNENSHLPSHLLLPLSPAPKLAPTNLEPLSYSKSPPPPKSPTYDLKHPRDSISLPDRYLQKAHRKNRVGYWGTNQAKSSLWVGIRRLVCWIRNPIVSWGRCSLKRSSRVLGMGLGCPVRISMGRGRPQIPILSKSII